MNDDFIPETPEEFILVGAAELARTNISAAMATIRYGRVVNRWVKHELRRTSGAKCLILIGPSGTGKTSFAKSLPGYYNYFDGQWQLDIWKNFTSYSIFDNIGWDEFEEKRFPNKKHILAQYGYFNVQHEIGVFIEINCTQPAIVLLNQSLHEGQLGRPPITYEEEREAKFWKEHAIIYRMGKHTFSFHPTEFI
ncbi:unnamed protein product [Rotaria sp. Silwood2]|nr:unnamed protein product [Rotaria sp. Silwood2]CAF4394409.1 unnamed protein product [Rotaria sp. Silwood2]